MKTYYIVKENKHGEPDWYYAYNDNIFTRMHIFDVWFCIIETGSWSADRCEENLRKYVTPKSYKVVRVVRV